MWLTYASCLQVQCDTTGKWNLSGSEELCSCLENIVTRDHSCSDESFPNFSNYRAYNESHVWCVVPTHTSWTWLSGDKTRNSLLSKANPGGRSGGASWVQPDVQALWMFGGEHHREHDQPQLSNDLWKLDLASRKWQLIHNGTGSKEEIPEPRQLSAACGVTGAYFILFGGLDSSEQVLGDTWLYYIPDSKWYRLSGLRVKLGLGNETVYIGPGPRGDAAVWCHQSDHHHLAVFGGFGENKKLLHDFWMFDLDTLLWMQAHSSAKLPPDSEFVRHLLYPAGRSGATTWMGTTGMYMFGGNIQEGNVGFKHLNNGNIGDMWKYDWLHDNWTLVSGDKNKCTGPGRYGTYGRKSQTNQPGCRRNAASWVDSRGNLWMFGGDGVDKLGAPTSAVAHSRLLSDLWYFSTESRLWAWKGGEQVGDKGGNYGDSGDDRLPGSRSEAVGWAVDDYFYLFGGLGNDKNGAAGYLNDIWELDVHLDPLVELNAASAGSVFAIVISGVVIVRLLFLLFFCIRGYLQKTESSGKYGPLRSVELND